MSDADRLFAKSRAGAPDGFFAAEAAGLAWLAEATAYGGVPAPVPVEVTRERIVLPRLASTPPTRAAAEDLGRRLAATHRAGAPHHGAPPGGWSGDGWIATLPLPHVASGPQLWGPFYAEHRLAPFARAARDRGALDPAGAATVDRLCERLADPGDPLAASGEPSARLHGDLWSGNVLWTPAGAVLVDPAAHGGHRETDLAMLALFGLPHLDRVLAAYDEAWPLADGWRRRVALHQVHPLLVHSVLFGGGYGTRAVAAAAASG